MLWKEAEETTEPIMATTSTTTNNNNSNAPLALQELRPWLLPAALEWIQQAEDREADWLKANETELEANGADLFADNDNSDNEEKDDPYKSRVRAWCTSRTNPDGIFQEDWERPSQRSKPNNNDKEDDDKDEIGGVRIIYMLSESWQGYGDILWASARHISNLLGDPESCRRLLGLTDNDTENKKHPLMGLGFCELGAGAGVPSWTAMHCGARVVCTDQAVPDRIRCIAECAERNFRAIKSNNSDDNKHIAMAAAARACALDWGGSVDEVLECLDANKQERFDVIVAADCCYMPWLQPRLLDSIYALMSDRGVALVPFALHGNAKDEDVWGVVDRAKERGFQTEILEPQQLTPPHEGMGMKQALVQTVRLTKPQS